jgi:hypothetical protein
MQFKKFNDNVNKKWVRVLTVIGYVISVSLVAIFLGLYYRFWWTADYNLNEFNKDDFNHTKVSSIRLSPRFDKYKPLNNSVLVQDLVKILSENFLVKTLKINYQALNQIYQPNAVNMNQEYELDIVVGNFDVFLKKFF